MTSKYELTAYLRRNGYNSDVRSVPVTVYADDWEEATRLAKERIYPAWDFHEWRFGADRISEVEPHKVPPKTVDLSPESLEQLAKIFSSKIETPKESTVNPPVDLHGCKTPEDFQLKYIDRYGDRYEEDEYEAVCAWCGWAVDGLNKLVIDIAAYEHAEKHVNEEKEHN